MELCDLYVFAEFLFGNIGNMSFKISKKSHPGWIRRIHTCRRASKLVGPNNWIDWLWNPTLERLAVVTRRVMRRVQLNVRRERLAVSSQLSRGWTTAARPQSGPAGVRQPGRKNLFVPVLPPHPQPHPRPDPPSAPQRSPARSWWVSGINQYNQRCGKIKKSKAKCNSSVRFEFPQSKKRLWFSYGGKKVFRSRQGV